MVCTVIGVREKSFKSSRDGNQVNGYDLHYSYPERGYDGEFVESCFISKRKCEDAGGWIPKPGDMFETERGRDGRFREIAVVPNT